MCGIAGILGNLSQNRDNIYRMCDAIQHRGPDGQGVYFDEKISFVLGHKRLSIMDLSENGSQPMISSDKRWVISFNGEIYNHYELRAIFFTDKHWRGTSDTETLLEMIAEHGVDKTLDEIRGMYAIAAWDKRDGVLYLIRDAMGEKPLYYGLVNENFIFASEIGAIETITEFNKEIDTNVLGTYFRYGYIPAPMSIYKGIKKLEPGSILCCGKNELIIRKFWDIDKVVLAGKQELFSGNFYEASIELERLLKSAINEQMRADVAYGGYLSAGIDSSVIISIMQSISAEPVNTFSIGIKGTGDEAVIAKKSAEILGTHHHEHYLTINDVADIIPKVSEIYSEPFADNSAVSTYLLSKFAKKYVTVSLSGDGGDELFGGYDIYFQVKKWWDIIKQNNKEIARQRLLEEGISAYKVERYLDCSCIEDVYLMYYDYDENLGRMKIFCSDKDSMRGFIENDIEKIMLLNQKQYMPDDCLAKVDRAGMAASMENRIPLLDKRIVQFVWSLPAEYKFEEGCSKRILRNILYKYLPKDLMEQPKRGFNIPISKLMNEKRLRTWADDIMASSLLDDYMDLGFLKKAWNNYKETGIWKPIIYYYLILADWYKKRINS